MKEQDLGRLERIRNLRSQWPDEATDFTPWLAQDENLELLGEALGMELEFEAKEAQVGSFRADIVCVEVSTSKHVLIENQLTPTDHDHLGKLLTYAAGFEADTIVWIAECFKDEHRAALDRLNRITNDGIKFFGLEIELYRIGDSPLAPKFEMVSKPNDWSRAAARATHRTDDLEQSKTQELWKKYWTEFQKALMDQSGPVTGRSMPQSSSWMGYAIGNKDFRLDATVSKPKRQLRVALRMHGEDAKSYFGLLEQQKEDIERKFKREEELMRAAVDIDSSQPPKNGLEQYGKADAEGSTSTASGMMWENLPNKKSSRISFHLPDIDPEDENDWPRQHKWLADHLNALHRVFSTRIKSLDPKDWQDDDD